MSKFRNQYPDLYKDSNESYTYFCDDGKKISYFAGKDGVTEKWIAWLKAEHRAEKNLEYRAKRYRWNGEKNVATVISLDMMDDADLAGNLMTTDAFIDPEQQYIRQCDRQEMMECMERALVSLSPIQLELLIKVQFRHIPQSEIARQECVDCTAIRNRLRKIHEKIKKYF